MILTVVIYVISLMLGLLAFLLPSFQIIPAIVFEMITNIITWTMELNSIFFFIDNLLNALVFFLQFLTYFTIYKISVLLLNYFRGSDSL